MTAHKIKQHYRKLYSRANLFILVSFESLSCCQLYSTCTKKTPYHHNPWPTLFPHHVCAQDPGLWCGRSDSSPSRHQIPSGTLQAGCSQALKRSLGKSMEKKHANHICSNQNRSQFGTHAFFTEDWKKLCNTKLFHDLWPEECWRKGPRHTLTHNTGIKVVDEGIKISIAK